MAAERYLLDTSVFCQPLKRQADAVALTRWRTAGDAACAISIVTRAEVEWGLYKAALPRWWALYDQILQSRLRILPTDTPIWSEFARMKAVQSALGRPVPDLDLLIAATAIVHRLILATHNLGHFQLVQGLVVEDWSRA